MARINEPVSLRAVGFFSAPSDRIVRPVGIGPGEELCEILTGGKVFFEQDGELRTFGRGTIFWHIAGDETICRTPSEDPYRCLTIRFTVMEDRRVMPRVSRWADEAGFEDFVHTRLSVFTTRRSIGTFSATICTGAFCGRPIWGTDGTVKLPTRSRWCGRWSFSTARTFSISASVKWPVTRG